MSREAQPSVDVSVVIPVLNDRASLGWLLRQLVELAPTTWEVVVVDGGSSDGSGDAAECRGARLIHAEASRGVQQDRGFAACAGSLLWFLHADSVVDAMVIRQLQQVYQDMVASGSPVWGRFDVQLRGRGNASRTRLNIVAKLMNWRSRVTGICTGDQGIFVSLDLLTAVGGVPRQALMEDIELSKRLKAMQRPLTLRARLESSGRRWESQGFFRTVLLMWQLRLRYFLGESPEQLAKRYYS